MENKKVYHWIRLTELRLLYLHSLDRTNEVKMLFSDDTDFVKDYKPEAPTLKGFIGYVRAYKIEGFDTAIVGNNNNIIKIAYGK